MILAYDHLSSTVCINFWTFIFVISVYFVFFDIWRELWSGVELQRRLHLTRLPPRWYRRYAVDWRTTNFEAGDVVALSLDVIHMTAANCTDSIRLSCDTRWQPVRPILLVYEKPDLENMRGLWHNSMHPYVHSDATPAYFISSVVQRVTRDLTELQNIEVLVVMDLWSS